MTTPLAEHVVGEIKAGLARKNLRQRHVAEVLGISSFGVSMRLQGKTPFRLEEIGKIADLLEVPVETLVTRPHA